MGKNRKDNNKKQRRWMKRLNRRQQLNTVTPTEEKEPNDVWHFDIELESNDKSEQPIIKIDNNDNDNDNKNDNDNDNEIERFQGPLSFNVHGIVEQSHDNNNDTGFEVNVFPPSPLSTITTTTINNCDKDDADDDGS